ncbi:RNA polymerase sigma factor [uncultured Enterovirga sp.]|uniref:RNA polymerase sigma factor n=1 Tax=uncultured Enterovirga sp. TaxID=2026352 RepID=UPI0035CC9366
MTDAVPPLAKTFPDGRPYTRMAEVEDEIARLAELPFDELVERGRISIRSHPQFVRPETLMHFLRGTRRDNRDQRFDALFRLVLRRLLLALPQCERVVGEDTFVDSALSDVEDRVRGRFLELVTLDRAGGDRMDFFEVHFDEAIAKLRLKAAKTVGGRARRSAALEGDARTGELPEVVERAAGSFDEPDDAFLSDPIFRKRLYPEIDHLKPEQKKVITMQLANIQTHSSDPSVSTISKALGCDERTVRNRRRDAIVALRKALGLGEDQ